VSNGLIESKVRRPNKTLTMRRFAAIIFHPPLFKAAPKKARAEQKPWLSS
jgi:hypothetical protein